MTGVLGMIPDKTLAATTQLDSSAVAVHVVAGKVVLVVEEGGKLGDSKQVEIQGWIVDHPRNIVGVCYVLVIDKFKANYTFVSILFCRCIYGIGLNLGQGEVPDKQRAFVGDDAHYRIINNERDAVIVVGDGCMSLQIRICCGQQDAS
jgi:hypothetical protein